MKKRKPPKNRSPEARALESPLFRHQVVPDKRRVEQEKQIDKEIKDAAPDRQDD